MKTGIMIPHRTSNGTVLVPITSEEYEKRIVWIDGTIETEMANEFTRQIIELNRQSTTEPIRIMISSDGGSVDSGLTIYDVICSSKAPIETYCVGFAYSMAAVLLASGTKRYMLEHSKVMLHEPWIESSLGGNVSSIKSLSESLQKTKRQINEILCKHTGRTRGEMEKATRYDHFFNAKQAIEFGLVDEIAGIDKLI